MFLRSGAEILGVLGFLGSAVSVPSACVLHCVLFCFPVHYLLHRDTFFCCFLSATMPPKAKRLILGPPRPKKPQNQPTDKLPGRQYHFYTEISRRSRMEAIPYARQQTLSGEHAQQHRRRRF